MILLTSHSEEDIAMPVGRTLLQKGGMDSGGPDVTVPSWRQAGWSSSCSLMTATAYASALAAIPKARSTMRASLRISCVRLKMAACPLRSARIHFESHDRRVGRLQRLETPHWTDQLLQFAMIGFYDIVIDT
jgi:hypothetical protein